MPGEHALGLAPLPNTQPKLDAAFYYIMPSQLDWGTAQWEEDLGHMTALGMGRVFVTFSTSPGWARILGRFLAAASSVGLNALVQCWPANRK